MRIAAAWLALAACGAPQLSARDATEPELVVLLVIDQWPEWAFEAKRPALDR